MRNCTMQDHSIPSLDSKKCGETLTREPVIPVMTGGASGLWLVIPILFVCELPYPSLQLGHFLVSGKCQACSTDWTGGTVL